MGYLAEIIRTSAGLSERRASQTRSSALVNALPSALQIADLAGLRLAGVSREIAMSIPTVAACRNLIAGTVAQLVVGKFRGTEQLPPGQLLTQPDPSATWAATIEGTVEDLLLYGHAAWLILATDGIATRANPAGLPVRARRVPGDQVERVTSTRLSDYDLAEAYLIGGQRVEPHRVIWFEASHEGVLSYGAAAIRQALDIEAAARRLAAFDLPAGVLTNNGAELGPDEAAELVQAFTAARRSNSVAFLQGLDYATHPMNSHDLQLTEARALSATEIARLFGVPVSMIAASPSGNSSSLLYQNLSQQQALMVTSAVAPVLAVIEQTLSMETVTPRGQLVAFDVNAFLRSDPEAALAFVGALVAAQVIAPEEARSFLGIPPVGQTLDNNQPGVI